MLVFPFYQLIPFQNPIQNLEESHLRAAPFWLHHSLYAVMSNIKLTPALDWIRDGFATGATKFITRQGECNVIVPSVISAATLHSRSICLWEECHEYSRFLYLQLCFPGLIVFKFVHQNRQVRFSTGISHIYTKSATPVSKEQAMLCSLFVLLCVWRLFCGHKGDGRGKREQVIPCVFLHRS